MYSFCKTLVQYFHIEKFYLQSEYDRYDLKSDVQYCLFYRNLEPLGCLEIEGKIDKYKMREIKRFRPTKLGVLMFTKDLRLNNYSFSFPGLNTAEA